MTCNKSLTKKEICLGSDIKPDLRPPKKSGGLSLTGFTLVEVIVAMVILALVVAGLLSVFLSSHRFVVRAKARLFAINQARAVAETLRNSVRQDQWVCDPTKDGIKGGDPDCRLGLPDGVNDSDWIQITDFAKYKIEKVGSNDYRKVTMEITYKTPNL